MPALSESDERFKSTPIGPMDKVMNVPLRMT